MPVFGSQSRNSIICNKHQRAPSNGSGTGIVQSIRSNAVGCAAASRQVYEYSVSCVVEAARARAENSLQSAMRAIFAIPRSGARAGKGEQLQ